MATIQLQTAIPGPKSKALGDRRASAIPRGLSHRDAGLRRQSRRRLDRRRRRQSLSSISPAASAASTSDIAASRWSTQSRIQLDRFLHTCVQVTPYEDYVRLAERMNQITPGKFPKKTLFVNTGAEAVENAVKIARAHTGRPGIIAFEDAFHGRTMMTLALTSKTHPYKAGFAPFPGDVYRIPYAYCYRCSYSLTYPSCDLFCARHLEDTFKRVVASEDVAAVIAEPVLGEGGFVVPPQDFFRVLMEICHKHGVLFIADEVQSGFGRTGKLFASEHYGIEPDILVTAKSLGGGFLWPRSPDAPKSWMLPAPAASAELSPAIRFPAPLPLPCWISSSMKICWRAPTNSASSFKSVRAMAKALATHRRRPWSGRNAGDRTGEVARNTRTRLRRDQEDHAILLRARADHDYCRHVWQRDSRAGAAGRHRRSRWMKAWTCWKRRCKSVCERKAQCQPV